MKEPQRIFIKVDSTISDCTLFTHDNNPVYLNEPTEPMYCFTPDELKEFASKVWDACANKQHEQIFGYFKNKSEYLSSLNIKP